MNELKKFLFQKSHQIFNRFKLSEQAAKVCAGKVTSIDAIDALNKEKCHYELIQFLAHGLPAREAVWWASLCLLTRKDDWNRFQQQAIVAAQDWVKMPDEDMRRRCEHFANKLTLKCAPSWLVQAVFWNGSGSIVAPELPDTLPDPNLFPKAIAGAINLAAAMPQWDHTEKFQQFAVHSGIDIAKGGRGQLSVKK